MRDSSGERGMSQRILKRLVRSARYRTVNLAWKQFERAKRRAHGRRTNNTDRHLLIVGCQRSGTTHLERLFRADPRSCVFGEFSALSISPGKTAWQPLEDVVEILQSSGGGYSVARSLFSSHRTIDILDRLPGSVAVWVYRDAGSVVRSMLRKWGGTFRSVSERVESLPDGAWDLHSFWDDVETFAAKHSEKPAVHKTADVYAAFWLLRNQQFFDLGLDKDPRITLVDYETLTRNPRETLDGLWSNVGVGAPRATFPIRTRGSGQRPDTESQFSPAMQKLCDDLHQRLRRAEASH
ncbi:MAG: hypothetical protein AAFR75_01720 [Pseudomonadota bacterium]